MTKPNPQLDPATRVKVEEALGAKIDSTEGQVRILATLVFRATSDPRFELDIRRDLWNRFCSFLSATTALEILALITEEAEHTPIEVVISAAADTSAESAKKYFAQLHNILGLIHDKSKPPQ